MAVAFSSCHIYKKYELSSQESAIAADFRKSMEAPVDSTSLPYLGWEDIFKDPKLQSLIRPALANNNNLDNAKLNVDIAHAQLKGAKLSYFPSIAFTPNGGTASYGEAEWNGATPFPSLLNGRLMPSQKSSTVSAEPK